VRGGVVRGRAEGTHRSDRRPYRRLTPSLSAAALRLIFVYTTRSANVFIPTPIVCLGKFITTSRRGDLSTEPILHTPSAGGVFVKAMKIEILVQRC